MPKFTPRSRKRTRDQIEPTSSKITTETLPAQAVSDTVPESETKRRKISSTKTSANTTSKKARNTLPKKKKKASTQKESDTPSNSKDQDASNRVSVKKGKQPLTKRASTSGKKTSSTVKTQGVKRKIGTTNDKREGKKPKNTPKPRSEKKSLLTYTFKELFKAIQTKKTKGEAAGFLGGTSKQLDRACFQFEGLLYWEIKLMSKSQAKEKLSELYDQASTKPGVLTIYKHKDEHIRKAIYATPTLSSLLDLLNVSEKSLNDYLAEKKTSRIEIANSISIEQKRAYENLRTAKTNPTNRPNLALIHKLIHSVPKLSITQICKNSNLLKNSFEQYLTKFLTDNAELEALNPEEGFKVFGEHYNKPAWRERLEDYPFSFIHNLFRKKYQLSTIVHKLSTSEKPLRDYVAKFTKIPLEKLDALSPDTAAKQISNYSKSLYEVEGLEQSPRELQRTSPKKRSTEEAKEAPLRRKITLRKLHQAILSFETKKEAALSLGLNSLQIEQLCFEFDGLLYGELFELSEEAAISKFKERYEQPSMVKRHLRDKFKKEHIIKAFYATTSIGTAKDLLNVSKKCLMDYLKMEKMDYEKIVQSISIEERKAYQQKRSPNTIKLTLAEIHRTIHSTNKDRKLNLTEAAATFGISPAIFEHYVARFALCYRTLKEVALEDGPTTFAKDYDKPAWRTAIEDYPLSFIHELIFDYKYATGTIARKLAIKSNTLDLYLRQFKTNYDELFNLPKDKAAKQIKNYNLSLTDLKGINVVQKEEEEEVIQPQQPAYAALEQSNTMRSRLHQSEEEEEEGEGIEDDHNEDLISESSSPASRAEKPQSPYPMSPEIGPPMDESNFRHWNQNEIAYSASSEKIGQEFNQEEENLTNSEINPLSQESLSPLSQLSSFASILDNSTRSFNEREEREASEVENNKGQISESSSPASLADKPQSPYPMSPEIGPPTEDPYPMSPEIGPPPNEIYFAHWSQREIACSASSEKDGQDLAQGEESSVNTESSSQFAVEAITQLSPIESIYSLRNLSLRLKFFFTLEKQLETIKSQFSPQTLANGRNILAIIDEAIVLYNSSNNLKIYDNTMRTMLLFYRKQFNEALDCAKQKSSSTVQKTLNHRFFSQPSIVEAIQQQATPGNEVRGPEMGST